MSLSSVLCVVAVAVMQAMADGDVQRGHHSHIHEEDSHADHYHGHSMLDFSSVGILLALKLKLILLGLAVAAVAIMFKNKQPSYGYYPYIDYQYVGYEVPPGTYVGAPYRRPTHSAYLHPNTIGPKSFYLSELTARVWNSIDVTGMALSAMGVPQGPCRHKVVCQAERAADRNVVMRTALSWLGDSLSKYKPSRSPESGIDAQPSCEALFANCPNHNLPEFLGGSGTRPVLTPPGNLGHFKQNHWFGHYSAQEWPGSDVASGISKDATRLDPRKDMMKTPLTYENTKSQSHHS